jgi:hypothetical protein
LPELVCLDRHVLRRTFDQQSFAAVVDSAAKQTGRSKALVPAHGFENRFNESAHLFVQRRDDSGTVYMALNDPFSDFDKNQFRYD